MKMIWLDGESLSDESFSNFHKMEKLELLSISFCDTMGSAGLKSISQLSKLGETECNCKADSQVRFMNPRTPTNELLEIINPWDQTD